MAWQGNSGTKRNALSALGRGRISSSTATWSRTRYFVNVTTRDTAMAVRNRYRKWCRCHQRFHCLDDEPSWTTKSRIRSALLLTSTQHRREAAPSRRGMQREVHAQTPTTQTRRCRYVDEGRSWEIGSVGLQIRLGHRCRSAAASLSFTEPGNRRGAVCGPQVRGGMKIDRTPAHGDQTDFRQMIAFVVLGVVVADMDCGQVVFV